jgi:HlyD family secretion protein
MMALLPPTPIFEIADMSQLRVRAQVDEADIGRVVVGQEVWVTADAYGSRRFRGRVSQVGLMMGPKNFRTDKPGEKMDTKLLEAVVDLEPDVKMPIGLRVDVLFTAQVGEARTASSNTDVSQTH